jgi:predicted transcriptional regulator YdeE
METYLLKKNVTVFGFEVKTFPEKIGEAFDSLIAKVPEGLNRSYYGISFMNSEGKPVYVAAVEERNKGEADKNMCERYTIERGKYFTVTINDWRKKTGSIKNVFEEMMKSTQVDLTKPCIEWYKNDFEMVCMLKALEDQNA